MSSGLSWVKLSALSADSERADLRPPARPDPDPKRIRSRLAPCPEIDCLRHMVPPARLAAAELRAAETATGADRVLVTEGVLTDADYVRAFAFHHNVGIETFEGVPRASCPLGDDELISGLASGMIPIGSGEGLVWVVAPWQLSARFLVDQLRRYPDIRARIRIATMESLRNFIHREAEAAVARKAAFELRATRPEMSAGTAQSRSPLAWFAAGIGLVVALSAVQSNLTVAIDIAFALIFLGWSGLRVLAILLSSEERPELPPRNDDTLPVYSIIVAIYNEAESVPALAEALMRLDYPGIR